MEAPKAKATATAAITTITSMGFVIGHWLLVIGCWSLVICHWWFVIGGVLFKFKG
jgi:hypothetical protein